MSLKKYFYDRGIKTCRTCKFVEDLEDEDGNEIEDTRKWYVISPFKPKDVVITEDNEGLVKWLVSSSYNREGIKCEWDFDKHCIKEYD